MAAAPAAAAAAEAAMQLGTALPPVVVPFASPQPAVVSTVPAGPDAASAGTVAGCGGAAAAAGSLTDPIEDKGQGSSERSQTEQCGEPAPPPPLLPPQPQLQRPTGAESFTTGGSAGAGAEVVASGGGRSGGVREAKATILVAAIEAELAKLAEAYAREIGSCYRDAERAIEEQQAAECELRHLEGLLRGREQSGGSGLTQATAAG